MKKLMMENRELLWKNKNESLRSNKPSIDYILGSYMIILKTNNHNFDIYDIEMRNYSSLEKKITHIHLLLHFYNSEEVYVV
jgi:hypothetical protein